MVSLVQVSQYTVISAWNSMITPAVKWFINGDIMTSLFKLFVHDHTRPIHWIWVSEWLLFNANSAIFQLYHGENMLIFNEMMMRYKTGICCFYAKHPELRRQSKDRLARNQNNVSGWNDMFTRRMLFQWASTTKIQLSVLI
jgi:hypothetical protein